MASNNQSVRLVLLKAVFIYLHLFCLDVIYDTIASVRRMLPAYSSMNALRVGSGMVYMRAGVSVTNNYEVVGI